MSIPTRVHDKLETAVRVALMHANGQYGLGLKHEQILCIAEAVLKDISPIVSDVIGDTWSNAKQKPWPY